MELRRILQAVEEGEITPEDGEKLIEALFEFENERAERYAKEVSNSEFVLEKGERLQGDLLLMNSHARIAGVVAGSLDVVNSSVELVGVVEGNLNAVHSRIDWLGGKVLGNVRLVMSNQSGEERIGGRKEVVDTDWPPKDTKLEESLDGGGVTIDGERYATEISGSRKVVVDGNVSVEAIDCEELTVRGRLSAGKVSCERVFIEKGGEVNVGKCSAEFFENGGRFKGEKVHFETIRNFGVCEVGKLWAETLENEGEVRCEVSTFEFATNRGLLVCKVAEFETLENLGRAVFDSLKAEVVENGGEISAKIVECDKLSGFDIRGG